MYATTSCDVQSLGLRIGTRPETTALGKGGGSFIKDDPLSKQSILTEPPKARSGNDGARILAHRLAHRLGSITLND